MAYHDPPDPQGALEQGRWRHLEGTPLWATPWEPGGGDLFSGRSVRWLFCAGCHHVWVEAFDGAPGGEPLACTVCAALAAVASNTRAAQTPGGQSLTNGDGEPIVFTRYAPEGTVLCPACDGVADEKPCVLCKDTGRLEELER